MRLATALRTPYRSRTIVRSGNAARMSDASLGSGVVWTQLLLLSLCAARVGTDWLRGRATMEGGVAFILLVAFTMCLVAEAIVGATRGPAPARRDTPPGSSGSRTAGMDHAPTS
jgi:hypothetical protein